MSFLLCLSLSSLEWRSSASDCGHGTKRWVYCSWQWAELIYRVNLPTNGHQQIIHKQIFYIHPLSFTPLCLHEMLPVALLNQKGMSCFPVGRPSEQWTEEGNLMYFTDSFIEISQIWGCQRGVDIPMRVQLLAFHIENKIVPIHPSHTAAANLCFHYVLILLD